MSGASTDRADRNLAEHRLVYRVLIGGLGLVQTIDGLYALFAPSSFYGDFPAGRGWVETLPAYNEHLVRDVGSLFLATGVLLLIAAWLLDRRTVRIALVVLLIFAIPHLVYHAFNLGPYGTGDAIANVIALALTVLPPVGMLWTLRPGPAPPGT